VIFTFFHCVKATNSSSRKQIPNVQSHQPSTINHHQAPFSNAKDIGVVIMSDTAKFIPEHRRQQHKGKNQFRGDELRRRREDQQVEIRKQKKEENLAKRRNLTTATNDWDVVSGDNTSESEDENGIANRKVGSCNLERRLTLDS
jgi:Importin beta binding domain